MKHHLDFDTVEDGQKALEAHIKLRDSMGGALWWGVTDDECKEIQNKIWEIKFRQPKPDANEN